MSFKRVLFPESLAAGEKLTSALVGIGFRLTAPKPKVEPNIEDTLIAASIEGIIAEDYRVLALLVDWISIHIERVNVDRLTKLASSLKENSVKAFWAAIAHWQRSDPRMKKLRKVYTKQKISLLEERGTFLLKRDGEDERFIGSPFIVPAKVLRHRSEDILNPSQLAKKHCAYRWRLLIGPSYRADMWALLENNHSITASDLARRSYGSFPTAWGVKHDWTFWKQAILR